MKATYIRVSSLKQNTARQETNIIGKSFTDKCSGAIPFDERPNGSKVLKMVESGEITELHVHAIDRLGRNQLDILETIEKIKAVGCQLEIANLGLKMLLEGGKVNPAFTMVVSVLSNIAEMERESIKEKQAEGIAIAKAKGIYKKRATRGKIEASVQLKKHADIVELLNDGKSIRKTAQLTKKGVSTVQRIKTLMA